MSKIHIVFLGQLRNWQNFLKQIKVVKAFNNPNITMSYFVDKDEISTSQLNELEKLIDQVVCLDPPSETFLLKYDPHMMKRSAGIRKRSGGMRRGSLWRQLIDLNHVYASFDKDDYIIRSRTDLLISESFLSKIIARIEQGELQKKVWVQWWNILEPFYIHDTAFAGRVGVLRKYIDKEANLCLAKYYPTNSLPVFFWILPFIQEEWVKKWLKKYSKSKPSVINLYRSDYRQMLQQYIKVVNRNFYVEFGEIYWYLQWSPKPVRRIWKNYLKLLGPLNLFFGRVFIEFNFKNR